MADRLLPVRWRGSSLRRAQVTGALGALGAGAVLSPPLGLLAAMVAWWVPLRRARRADASARATVVRDLPDVIEVFRLALAAGSNVWLAVEMAAGLGRGPVTDAFAAAAGRIDLGERQSVALEGVIDELGDPARPLVRILASSDLAPHVADVQLAVLASDARATRRRHAETEARRVPVRLLAPLVVCILPAFALLTVVPVIAGSLRSIATG